jgi:glucose/arabinose dehydrogenase
VSFRHILLASMFLAAPAVATMQACSGADTEEPGADEGQYKSVGLCAGLPKVNVQTPPGICVGVVASGFRFTRGIAERKPGEFFVADMGGWAVDKGSIWKITRQPNGTYLKKQLLAQIDKPSGVQIGPDGKHVYVGTPANIFRFDPDDTSVNGKPRLKVVIKAPAPEGARHPLKQFVFDKKDPSVLYVNVGSASDVCEAHKNANPCPEAEGDEARGAIRKYKLGPDGMPVSSQIVARGLRNSMALEVHPTSGLLLQGENSRDLINKADPKLEDEELPHEELNAIDVGGEPKHYGWPYCFDNNVNNPEYPNVDCSKFKAPALLLPPHTAPLGMKYYTGDMFPDVYKGNLILGYHGYKPYGHRLVMVPVDERGVPRGEPLDIIRDWDKKVATGDPQGAPVDVIVAKDGSIYVTEDKNGDILRVVYESGKGDGKPLVPVPPKKIVDPEEQKRCDALEQMTGPLADLQREVLDAACTSCHGTAGGAPGGFVLRKCDPEANAKRLTTPWSTIGPLVKPGDTQSSPLLALLKGEGGLPQMPAGGISPEQTEVVLEWIRAGAPSK